MPVKVEVVHHPANKDVGRWVQPEQADLFTMMADAKRFVVLAKRWVVTNAPKPGTSVHGVW